MNPIVPLHFLRGMHNKIKKELVEHAMSTGNDLKSHIDNALSGLEQAEKRWDEACEKAQIELDICRREGLVLLVYTDVENFPAQLRQIPDPPMVLFGRGRWNNDKVPLAIIGSRKATHYGLRTTRDLVLELSRYPVHIISGLALGIDGHSHRTALEMGATTSAFVAGGMGHFSPRSHQKIADQMVDEGGGYFTEQPFHQPSERQMYPVRNRLIAGSSLATVVIEAAKQSGAMITANQAFNYHRELFALPGALFQPMSAGPNALIHQQMAVPIHDLAKFPGEFYPVWANSDGEIDFSESIEGLLIREFPHGRKVQLYHLYERLPTRKQHINKGLAVLIDLGVLEKIGPNVYCRKTVKN